MAMANKSSEAKRQMLTECRSSCRGNAGELSLIDEFARTYQSIDAIKWYTRPCFLYRVVNKALRTEDVRALYTFRYFIVDMCTCLEQLARETITKHTASFFVYRGSRLSRSEVEQLHIGTLVATKGFFSSSRNLDVAQLFLGIDSETGMTNSRSREDQRQFVLFGIDVNLIDSTDTIVADVAAQSTVQGENEMIFGLGTTFIVTRIYYDEIHYLWNIRMVTSSEMSILIRDYTEFTRDRLKETDPTILFGQYLCDMSTDYTGAITYFYRMLHSAPADDEIRPSIYHQLGRVYHCMGKYQEAIMSFRTAQLLRRRRLSQMNFDCARILSDLGLTYSEIGNSARAMHLQIQAMKLLRSCLPANHVEIILSSIKLAYTYWQERKYDCARILLLNALKEAKQKLPYSYIDHAQALHTMGLVERTLGDRKKASECFEKALHMRKLLLASDHPSVGRTFFELSVLHAELEEENAVSIDYAQRALTIYETKLTAKHNQHEQATKLLQYLLSRKKPAVQHFQVINDT